MNENDPKPSNYDLMGQWISDVLDAIDPIEVVSQWVYNIRLTHGGTVLTGECPFGHDSGVNKRKRWGMVLNREEDYRWNCFYCSAVGDAGKGNILSLVGTKMGLTYIESVEYLADMYGIPRPDEKVSDEGIPESEITTFLTSVTMKWHKDLLTNDEAMRYLTEKRGLTLETINAFNLGYCSKTPYPKKNKDLMLASGLFKKSTKPGKEDTIYPVLEDCITIPVFRGNNVSNITSRRLHTKMWKDKDGEEFEAPNHIHIREHRVFFNQIAAQRDETYIVESPLDAISYEQAGYHALATMGAGAYNERCAKRFTKDGAVYLSFDTDRAGITATHKMARYLFNSGRWNIRVVSFDVQDGLDKMDANAYFLNHSREEFMERVEVTVETYVSWALRMANVINPLNHPMIQLNIIGLVRPIIRNIAHTMPIARECFLQQISETTRMTMQGLRTEANTILEDAKE